MTESPASAVRTDEAAARPTGVTVLIVNYNTRDRVLDCLASLAGSGIDELGVVLVDNGSTDGSADAVAARFPAVTLVRSTENLGFGKAVNLAARSAGEGSLILLNPDTTVLPGSLLALVEFAARHPEYRMYGGRTLRPDRTLDPSSCWGAPTLWSLFCWAAGLSSVFRRSAVFDPESLGRWARDTVREVPIITGCLLLISQRDFQSLNGFDETYFLYGEDADLSLRARQHGLRPVIVPDAVVVHDNGGSTAGSGRKMAMVWAGRSTYLKLNWSPWRARAGIALLQAGALIRAVAARALKRGSGEWTDVWERRAAWRDGYPHARTALFGSEAAA